VYRHLEWLTGGKASLSTTCCTGDLIEEAACNVKGTTENRQAIKIKSWPQNFRLFLFFIFDRGIEVSISMPTYLQTAFPGFTTAKFGLKPLA
jgi:hypothetical protein